MANWWEEHYRYLVKDEAMAKSYCLAVEDGLALMTRQFPELSAPVAAFILPSEQTAPDFKGERFALRLIFVGCEAEALKWFEEMHLSQPWNRRH